ncbi:hypothetical protein OAH21_02275 [bacterium]|nr:hypothetical protein [bacterium]
MSNLLPYALGAEFPVIEAGADPSVAGGLLVLLPRKLAADDVLIEVQRSSDLRNWTTTRSTKIESANRDDGIAIETWAIAPNSESLGRLYLRVAVSSR